MLAEDIAKLMALIPLEEQSNVSEPMVKGTNIVQCFLCFFFGSNTYKTLGFL